MNIKSISDLTLRPNENQRDVSRIPEVGHLRVVIIDGVETRLVFQTEHKDDRVHPGRELQERSTCLKRSAPSITKVICNFQRAICSKSNFLFMFSPRKYCNVIMCLLKVVGKASHSSTRWGESFKHVLTTAVVVAAVNCLTTPNKPIRDEH
jgi:hypothetical protein